MTKRYRRHADLRLTELDGEGLALHLGNRKYFTLSESGLVMLNALDKPCGLNELVEVLLAEYDVTPEKAGRSARHFLDECEQAGLVIVDEQA